MQVDEALGFADQWIEGITVYEGLQGWRIVCATLAAEVRQLRSDLALAQGQRDASNREIAECDALRSKLADILTRTANALKGEPGPLQSHSWHDLPERVTAAMNALAGAMELAFANVQHDSDCAMHNAPAYPNGPCDCSVAISGLRLDVERLRDENESLRGSLEEWKLDFNSLRAERGRLRDENAELRQCATAVLRDALDRVDVHPCDAHDDTVRARGLSEEMRALYDAAMQKGE